MEFKNYYQEVAGVNIDSDPKMKKVIKNINDQIIRSGRGGVTHHPAISPEDLK